MSRCRAAHTRASARIHAHTHTHIRPAALSSHLVEELRSVFAVAGHTFIFRVGAHNNLVLPRCGQGSGRGRRTHCARRRPSSFLFALLFQDLLASYLSQLRSGRDRSCSKEESHLDPRAGRAASRRSLKGSFGTLESQVPQGSIYPIGTRFRVHISDFSLTSGSPGDKASTRSRGPVPRVTCQGNQGSPSL